MSNHNTRPPELLPTARERSTSRRGRLPRQPLPLVAVLVALAALTPASAAADDALGSAIGLEARLQPLGLEAPDGSPYAHRGAAELDAIAHALATRAAVPDHDPWGKRVCGVSAVAEPVFREEDLIPRWANLFHRNTRARVLRDALDIDEGDILTREAWLQAERNLRALGVFSVATVVTTWRFEPDCVELLVATRDRWSLLFNTVVTSNGSAVSDFTFGVSEANLFGTGNYLALTTSRGLGSWRVGPTLYAPRLGGSRVSLYQAFDVYFDREVGGVEGVASSTSVARGFTQPGQRFAWSAQLDHSDTLRRRYTGAVLDTWEYGDERVDERYRVTATGAQGSVTRQWGTDLRHRLSPGFIVSNSEVRAEPRDPTLSAEAVRAYTEARLPVAERRVGPTITYSIFQSRYLRLVELDTYGVGEEVRRGQGASATISYMEPGLGADERRADASVGYDVLVAMGDDAFISGAAGLGLRLRSEATDLVPSASLRVVTPRVMQGRIVARAGFAAIERDTRNALFSIGGDSGLRGYPIGFVEGNRRLQTNVEWRSRPVRLFQARLGAVAFADAGGAWRDGEGVALYPSVGVGLRLMLPLLGTIVRAGDISLPLAGLSRRPLVSIGVGQRF